MGSDGELGVEAISRGQSAGLLVVEAGRFALCRPGGEITPLTVGAAMSLLEDSPDVPELTDLRVNPTEVGVDLIDAFVTDGQPVATYVSGGHALAYSHASDDWRVLGRPHLQILDGFSGPVSVRTLVGGAGPDCGEVLGALSDLLTIGVLALVPAETMVVPTEPAIASELTTSMDSRPRIRSPLKLMDRLRSASRSVLVKESVLLDSSSMQPHLEVGGILDRSKVPVFSFWATDDGPPMGVAAVVAYARVHGNGVLNDTFEFRKMTTPALVLEDLSNVDGPAVVLCGNYDWSLDANIDVVRRAHGINRSVIFFHGGPSTPSAGDACEEFLRDLPGCNIAVIGEGELTFADALSRLAESLTPDRSFDPAVLSGVEGIRLLDPISGDYVHSGARARHDALADFPSALLSGELDLVPDDALNIIALESNRGCPYSCTFCDWGAATMSRVRAFPVERIRGELEWLAAHRVDTWYIADANFGILPRDVEIAQMIAELRDETGYPKLLVAFPAKNSTERYLDIMDTFIAAGIDLKAALALQTRDADTLAAVQRSNIRTESYDRLAVESRRRGLPLLTELMIGLPGSTVESFKNDLQWGLERQVRAFLYPTVVLPNAPMNDPVQRELLAIRTVDGRVISTSTFSEHDRRTMDRLAAGYHCLEVLGSLRHVLRYLQWDHGRRAIDVIHEVVDLVDQRPDRYPLLSFHLDASDTFLIPAVGWRPLLAEASALLVEDLGVADDSGFRTAMAVSEHLMAWPGRQFPDVLAVEHDYEAYFSSTQGSLSDTGEPAVPVRPLREFGPGKVVVEGDPLDIVAQFGRWDDTTDPFQQAQDFELESTLAVYHSTVATR